MRNFIVMFAFLLPFGCHIKVGYESDEVLESYLQDSFLNAHNELRLAHGRGLLEWDQGLAAYAKSWARSLSENCRARQSFGTKFGENISQRWGSRVASPSVIVRKWYDDKSVAYEQVLWLKTTKIGCAYSLCNDELSKASSAIYVCEYFPPVPSKTKLM